MTLLLGVLLFFIEEIADKTLEPVFERQGLEKVSLLGAKSRDRLDLFLNLSELQIRALARFYNPEEKNLERPAVPLLDIFSISKFEINTDAAKSPSKTQWTFKKDASALWGFGMQKGKNRPHVQLHQKNIDKFLPQSEKDIESIFISLSETSQNPEMSRWQKWAHEAGNLDQVEIIPWKNKSYFASLSPSAQYDFAILTLWPSDVVSAPWQKIKITLRWMMAMLLATTLLSIIFFVRALMSPLEELQSATEHLSQGHFDIRFSKKRTDELGHLMTAFESMSLKIQNLLIQTKHSARMEMELQTARLVQENFYPRQQNQFENVRVVGRTWAASECGGDLWACWETEDFVYVFLGDATGHGVSAALMTSAVRAVIGILESSKMNSLPAMIDLLRKGIESTGRDTTWVSALLIQVEKKSGFVRQFNAGHEDVYIIPAVVDESLNWKQLKILFEPSNPHLGMKADPLPLFATYQMESCEKLFLTTDGLLDIVDDAKNSWKPRQIMQATLDSFREAQHGANSPSRADLAMSLFSEKIEKRRQGQDLADDVSVVVIEWAPPGSAD